jgi:hypothetical protein
MARGVELQQLTCVGLADRGRLPRARDDLRVTGHRADHAGLGPQRRNGLDGATAAGDHVLDDDPPGCGAG